MAYSFSFRCSHTEEDGQDIGQESVKVIVGALCHAELISVLGLCSNRGNPSLRGLCYFQTLLGARRSVVKV